MKFLTTQARECDEEEVEEAGEENVLQVWEQEGKGSACATSLITVEATDIVVSIVVNIDETTIPTSCENAGDRSSLKTKGSGSLSNESTAKRKQNETAGKLNQVFCSILTTACYT